MLPNLAARGGIVTHHIAVWDIAMACIRMSACYIDFILYWHNMWSTRTYIHVYIRRLIKEEKKMSTRTVHIALVCRCRILPNQLIITHLTFGLFVIQMLYLDLVCCAMHSALPRFALFMPYIAAHTNHEFIYLISFHVQIENQYHFRSIVCAAGKLEWRFQIGYYINREEERMKDEKPATDIIFYVYLESVCVRIRTSVSVRFRVSYNMYYAIKMFVDCLWHKPKSERWNKRSHSTHTHTYTRTVVYIHVCSTLIQTSFKCVCLAEANWNGKIEISMKPKPNIRNEFTIGWCWCWCCCCCGSCCLSCSFAFTFVPISIPVSGTL